MTDMRAQREWAASRMPLVTVPHAVGAALATEIRARLERVGYTRYALVDRGSYDYVTRPPEQGLLEVLGGVAQDITGESLEIAEWRALRLVPGDYVLVRHDRVYEDSPIELVLDVSRAPVPGAEVHYRHRGQVFATVPADPGSLTLVRRSPTVMCNHTYVSKLHAGAEIVRLVVLLRASSPS